MAARKVTAQVVLKDVFVDEELYPRSQYNWQTAYDYSESLKTGAKFPVIILAKFNGKFYLVDGRHRLEAYRILKQKKIKADVYSGWTRQKIYEEAIRLNISHGRPLSPYEKRCIALKLRQWKYPAAKISDLIQISGDKLEHFIGQRLVNSLTGEVEHQAIVKSGIKHLAGGFLTEDKIAAIKQGTQKLYVRDQIEMLQSLIGLLKNHLLNRRDKNIKALLAKVKELI